MANLTPTPGWDDVFQLERSTAALGGAGGPMNLQAQALLNRFAYLMEESGATKIGYKRDSVSAVIRTLAAKLYDTRFVTDYGVIPDSSDDQTALIQAAIDDVSASGGGRLYFPRGDYRCNNLTLKNAVILHGEGIQAVTGLVTPATRLRLNSNGVILKTEEEISGAGAVGIAFNGGLVTTGESRGVWIGKDSSLSLGLSPFTSYSGLADHKPKKLLFDQCMFDNFRNEGMFAEYAGQPHLIRCFSQNCLKDSAYYASTRRYAVVIYADDAHIADCEFASLPGGNSGSVTSTNLYACAFGLLGANSRANSFIVNCVGELSDIGFVVNQKSARYMNCRADLNNGHGWYIEAVGGSFVGCHAVNNSQDTSDTYDGFYVNSTGVLDLSFSGCKAISDGASVHRYGFNDEWATNTAAQKNRYDASCSSRGHGTAWMRVGSTSAGPCIAAKVGASIAFADADTTPSVEQWGSWRTANTGATTITNFDDGVNGEVIEIRAGDGNTTIQNGSNIKTGTGGNLALVQDNIYRFKREGGVWYRALG